LLGLGCVALGSKGLSVREGAAIVEACLDQGITYIDCASTYGDAEVKVGEVMRTRRSETILATKTLEREKERAWKEIHRSLERLQTTRVDVLQLHAINRLEDLDRVMASDGAFAAAVRAREEGMCDHIGITGHTRVEVIAEAVKRYDFATTLVPLSPADARVSDFGETLFRLARERKFGIIAMKVLAAGRVTEYARESIFYALSLPVSTAVVGMGTVEEVNANVAAAREFRPMQPQESAALEEKTKAFATTSVLWWKRR
ncbi:MAG: aldo/keto reductase, partial [Proteobacteria bacterium]|nr:aldo/keto reductase [Pseudomonadota bacterium]